MSGTDLIADESADPGDRLNAIKAIMGTPEYTNAHAEIFSSLTSGASRSASAPLSSIDSAKVAALTDRIDEISRLNHDDRTIDQYRRRVPELEGLIAERQALLENRSTAPKRASKAAPTAPSAATAKVPATVTGYTVQVLPEKLHDGTLRPMFDQAQWVLALNDFLAAKYTDDQVKGMERLVLEFEKKPARNTTELIGRGLVKLRELGLTDAQTAVAVQQLERIEVELAEETARSASEAMLQMLSQQYGDGLVERVLAARGAVEDTIGKEAKDALSEVRLPDGSKLGDHPSFVAICMALAEVEENETETEDEDEEAAGET